MKLRNVMGFVSQERCTYEVASALAVASYYYVRYLVRSADAKHLAEASGGNFLSWYSGFRSVIRGCVHSEMRSINSKGFK